MAPSSFVRPPHPRIPHARVACPSARNPVSRTLTSPRGMSTPFPVRPSNAQAGLHQSDRSADRFRLVPPRVQHMMLHIQGDLKRRRPAAPGWEFRLYKAHLGAQRRSIIVEESYECITTHFRGTLHTAQSSSSPSHIMVHRAHPHP
jgi:hypothetical protein